ncbi:hypothetical protein FSP39_024580 [Pinctada imbricata]|uniref:C1q domain-containing protein n=1 Tax=Pinctada imbricata TaxID=66713 RepID=A0AA88XFD8_PINIB|nr:hypothetical protein FSP39_024580 [Pinctada imbricata]
MYSLTRSDGELWLELMKNNELVASIYAYTYADYADAGNAAVLKLQKGDTVYVKAHDDYDNSLYGEASQIYTTLTGELVFPDAKELDSANAVSAVGFTAALSVNASLPNGTQVVYDHVVTNVSPQGGGYDATTGTFTAPIDGAYVFHFYAVAHSSEEFWLELFHNNDFVESSYGYTSGSYADAGNTAVLHLKKGDTVYVKARPGHSVQLYGDSDELYTTFSGALLSPAVVASQAGGGVSNPGQQEIAFSVGLTHNFASSNGDKVLFNRVFSNLGQKYDINTGIFTAPVTGVYVFHYHVLAQYAQEVWVELMHNYHYVNTAYGHTAGSYGVGSNAAVIELTSGDQVYLDIGKHDSFLYGGTDEVYCTFSGYLLAPLPNFHPVVG